MVLAREWSIVIDIFHFDHISVVPNIISIFVKQWDIKFKILK